MHSQFVRSMNRSRFSRRYRQSSRSDKGVVMGVADLAIFIPIFVIGVFFMADLAQVGTTKERLSAVLTQAANYAVALPPDVEPTSATTSMVAELSKQNCLSISNMKVQVNKITISGCEAISVKVNGSIPLLKDGIFPAMVPVQDAAASLYPANRVYGAIAINPYPYSTNNPGAAQSVYVPIIRPRTGDPVWQFPYDAALNNLHVVQGNVPPPPSPELIDTYFKDRPSLY